MGHPELPGGVGDVNGLLESWTAEAMDIGGGFTGRGSPGAGIVPEGID